MTLAWCMVWIFTANDLLPQKKCVCPSLPTSCKCREKSVSAKHDGSIPPDLQRLAATFLWLRRHEGRICFCAAPKYVCLQYLEYSGLQPSFFFVSSREPASRVARWSFCVAGGRCGDRAPNGAPRPPILNRQRTPSSGHTHFAWGLWVI